MKLDEDDGDEWIRNKLRLGIGLVVKVRWKWKEDENG